MTLDTRYERALDSHGGFANAMAQASATARAQIAAPTEPERSIRDVAAGVAAPVLVGYVVWLLQDAQARGLNRLCFLSRDAQVCYELATRLAPRLGIHIDLAYVYSSRRTWSLAACDPAALDKADWLFNSFMRSNAADLCARLGINMDDYTDLLIESGVDLDPAARADTPSQGAALRRFVITPEVAAAVGPRIERMRELLRGYCAQEGIASTITGLVDAGWTGRLIGALHQVLEHYGLPKPHAYLWGHEPRASGWNDPQFVSAYMYSTVATPGVLWRVPDAPYIVETFCMADHAIVSDFEKNPAGRIDAILEPVNAPVEQWGLSTYRETLYAFCAALNLTDAKEDIRPQIAAVLRDFWTTPSPQEAAAWGAYPYDSDPIGRATLPLARPFDVAELQSVIDGRTDLDQGDRAWLQGSLALSGQVGRQAASFLAARFDVMGGPATD